MGGPRPLPSQPVRPQTPQRPAELQAIVRRRRVLRTALGRLERERDQSPRPSMPSAPTAPPPVTRTITLAEGMTVADLAAKLDVKAKDVLKKLMDRRMMMTINSTLDDETAAMIARDFGADVKMQTFEEELVQVESEDVNPEDLVTRAPVVTVMGHVDHGKTTLLDAIRSARVAEREAGGITQHIGAYAVQVNDRNVVFLDTPGHEAFTMMRARGARVTDVVVLVVAADDGVMPQTREAIDHARAAGVPILVAINKIDKPDANPDRVKQELSDLGLMPEEWGGTTVMVEVSAKKKQNLELLLEMVLLVTELSELKANPKRNASGTVLEAKLDKGRGPVATILVQDGTLRVGDTLIAGTIVGKVRALIDDRGRQLKSAGPATPVEVLGLGGLPSPGDAFQALTDAAKARQIATFRQMQAKEKALGAKGARLTLESLQAQIAEGGIKELPIIIKADVQGSAEVLADTLTKLTDEKVKVRIIHSGVGAINESDVLLASASNAIIIGFNVRPDRNAAEVADRESVDIRLHSVIYNVTDEMKKAMTGLLEPTFKEVRIGAAEVRDTFKTPKFGTIAGCMVTDGRITRSGDTQARLLRDNVVVYEGKIGSLRRFKDDVSEVKAGLRVRHRLREVQRHQGRRRHRGLRGREGRRHGLDGLDTSRTRRRSAPRGAGEAARPRRPRPGHRLHHAHARQGLARPAARARLLHDDGRREGAARNGAGARPRDAVPAPPDRQRLRLRRVPELEFFFDKSIEQHDRIEQILHEISASRAARSRERRRAPSRPGRARTATTPKHDEESGAPFLLRGRRPQRRLV